MNLPGLCQDTGKSMGQEGGAAKAQPALLSRLCCCDSGGWITGLPKRQLLQVLFP